MRNTTINFIYEAVINYPEKCCVSDNKNDLCFRDFFLKAFQIANNIGKKNIINQPIAVYLPKQVDSIVAFAGILLSGNFYVPLDIKAPTKRIEAILSNLNPSLIISKHEHSDTISSLSYDDKVIYLNGLFSENHVSSIEKMIAECRKITDLIIDTDPCYIMYTSGSTGIPKGVVVPHRGVIDYIEWAISCLCVSDKDRIGNQAPMFFDNSTLDIYLCWATCATLYLIPENMFMFPAKLVEYLEEKKITFVFFVPSVLINVAQINVLTPDRLPLLENIIFAGEVMPTKFLSYWQRILPDKRYVNLYGPTEITVDCTYFNVNRIYSADESLPIGYPCINSGVLILNKENKLAKIGEPGELCVRGSSLALGYWNEPQKTQNAFCQNPLQKNYIDLIYRTGDIVYKNEKKQIIFIGREDSQIKHMGYRIELGEIERTIGALAMIDKCCVLYNSTSKEISLFYESDKELDSANLRRIFPDILPSYMIPKEYIHYKKLPLNQNGKIDRSRLKTIHFSSQEE